jgi:hypothetical protein
MPVMREMEIKIHSSLGEEGSSTAPSLAKAFGTGS